VSSKASARPAGNTHCVAIDLGATGIRVVEVEWTGTSGSGGIGDARLVRRGIASFPTNVWSDLEAHRDVFVGTLRDAISAAGITAKSVVACLPRHLVTIRFAHLPHAAPDQMRSMVDFEAQQYILFSMDEVILDYHIVSNPLKGMGISDAEDMDTVLLAAARRSLVTEVMTIFDRAGLDLQQLSVSSLALAEHARDTLEPTALIDLEPGQMDVAVVAEGHLLFTRASALDLQGVNPDVADRRLAEEVARSFTSYQNEFRQKPISHILLSGASVAGTGAERIERSLSDVLEMPVARLQNRLLPPTDMDARAYATATGLALQTQPGSLASITLVPGERSERKTQQKRRQHQQLLAAAAILILLLGALGARNYLTEKAKLETATFNANAALTRAQAAFENEKRSHDRVQALETELTRSLDRSHPTIDVLVALDRSLPSASVLWLTQFSFDRGGLLTLHGEAKSASAATDLVMALQSSGAFNDVKLGYLGDAQDTDTGSVGTQSSPVRTGTPSANPTTPALPGMPNRTGVPATNSPGGPPPNTAPANGQPGPPGPGQGRPAGGPGPGGPTPGPPSRGPGGPPPGVAPGGPRTVGMAMHRSYPGTNTVTAAVSGSSNRVTPSKKAAGTRASASKAPSNAVASDATGGSRSTLTSFIITCRVNPRAVSLLPAGTPVMKAVPIKPSMKNQPGKPAHDSTDEPNAGDLENGDDSADSQ
jgi:Tfp pilus assembly PilM family ATPase/Tfp pilus assembly protein PilN